VKCSARAILLMNSCHKPVRWRGRSFAVQQSTLPHPRVGHGSWPAGSPAINFRTSGLTGPASSRGPTRTLAVPRSGRHHAFLPPESWEEFAQSLGGGRVEDRGKRGDT
jgi:hypothetical protein